MSAPISEQADVAYARPEARDAFLRALDCDDRQELARLACDLIRCSNPLPGITREELGLPTGATYGAAARHVLACATAGRQPSATIKSAVAGV